MTHLTIILLHRFSLKMSLFRDVISFYNTLSLYLQCHFFVSLQIQYSARMNLMRKLVTTSPRPVPESPQQQQDNALGLMHLRKLFGEFRHPPAGASQKELEDKLYNMLPLFCKVNMYSFQPLSIKMTSEWKCNR